MDDKKCTNPLQDNPYFQDPEQPYQRLLIKLYERALTDRPPQASEHQHRAAVRRYCENLLEAMPTTMVSMGRIYAVAAATGELRENDHAEFGWLVSSMADLQEALSHVADEADFDLRGENAA